MKIFIVFVFICFSSHLIYSQPDSFSYTFSLENKTDSIITDNAKPVSLAGAAAFSLLLPGAGLFLIDNTGFAIAYLLTGTALYSSSIVFSLLAKRQSVEIIALLFIAGGVVHFISIAHTLFATEEYNNNISPVVTYNGRVYQFGLSVRF